MMSNDSPPPADNQPPEQQISAGRDLVNSQIAGHDINVTTTHTGFSARDVQRLLITMAALLAVMFFCGFSGGIVVTAAALDKLSINIGSDPAAGEQMQQVFNQLDQEPAGTAFGLTFSERQISIAEMEGNLNKLNTRLPGTPFEVTFSEKQISSYARFILGPQLGVSEAKVRFMNEPGRFAFGGQWASLGNLEFAATAKIIPGDQPLQLEAVAVHILPGSGSFGWVAVPPILVQPIVDYVNESMADTIRIDRVTGWDSRWQVTGTK